MCSARDVSGAISRRICRESTLHDYLVRWNDDNTLTPSTTRSTCNARDDAGERADRVCDRQPEREEYRESAATLIRTATTQQEDQGKKRHILVDTLPGASCHRSSGRYPGTRWRILLISTLFGRFLSCAKCSPTAVSGATIRAGIACVFPQLDIEIVKRSDRRRFKCCHADGRRTTFAWLNRCRAVQDFENLTRNHWLFSALRRSGSCYERSVILNTFRTDSKRWMAKFGQVDK